MCIGKKLFVFVAAPLALSGCLGFPSSFAPGNNDVDEVGDVFFEITADRDRCADVPVTGYRDDNPVVPDDAALNVPYGPSDPGTYFGTFFISVSGPIDFAYTLDAPEAGVTRIYTQTLMLFRDEYGRCMDGTETGALAFRDEP